MRPLLLILLFLAGCITAPAFIPPTAVPTLPATAACGRFANLDHIPLPTTEKLTQASRPAHTPRYAAHTLFVDQHLLHHAHQLNMGALVQVLAWQDVQPTPDTWEWGAADALVRETLAADLHLILRLDMPPVWAARPDMRGLPFDLVAYMAFVSAVATRYEGLIWGYIIWNEPNLAAEWSYSGHNLAERVEMGGGRVADPADYVGVLGVAYRRIKAADPQARVASAGLAPTNENSLRAMDDRLFWQKMLEAGVLDCMDALAVHAYAYGQDPLAPATADGLGLERIAQLYQMMRDSGAEKPVWVTEMGYTVVRGLQPAVTEAQQGDYLVRTFGRIAHDWPWVELVTLWNLTYNLAETDEQAGYSLLAMDGSPRPAYAVVQQFLSD
ncbi:MAG: hypothetical protein OT477_12555 [Chloroflexi bacterium]|nr:hypothetical protein [Chloroflexota bacterium]